MLILQFIPENCLHQYSGIQDSPGCAGREGFRLFNSPMMENRKTRQNVVVFICFGDEGMNNGFILRFKLVDMQSGISVDRKQPIKVTVAWDSVQLEIQAHHLKSSLSFNIYRYFAMRFKFERVLNHFLILSVKNDSHKMTKFKTRSFR